MFKKNFFVICYLLFVLIITNNICCIIRSLPLCHSLLRNVLYILVNIDIYVVSGA